MSPEERVHAQTRAQWRNWLKANHDRPSGIWLVSGRKGSGHEPVAYENIVEEALTGQIRRITQS